MLNDLNNTLNSLVTINKMSISFYAAIISFISMIASLIFSVKNIRYNEQKDIKMLITNINENIDDIFLSLNDFIKEFLNSKETQEKKLNRDKILYLLDTTRVKIETDFIFMENHFYELHMKISDITYENNIEKVLHSLNIIKNNIEKLKKNLIQGV